MAVFITGGHGQIASWIAYLLAKEGQQVIIYDVNAHAPDYLLEVSEKIQFVKGDVLDLPALTDTLKRYRHKIDGIIHTVGIMGELVQLNPHYNITLNVMGLVNVLDLARIFEIKKVVYTSTGAVYGIAEGIVPETTPASPTDLYASTKSSAEYIGRQYENTFDIDFRVSRVYFVYGPGKLPSRFINLYKIAFGALEGIEGLRMERGADQKVDFTYAVDAARGTALLYNAENLRHKVFNIATGQAHTVGEVVELAQKHTHFPVKVEVGPGELMRRCEALDISRAREELGYEPQYSLEEGIQLYADWMKNQRPTR